MSALLWMVFQAGVTGSFIYRELARASGLGRDPQPLPAFLIGTTVALSIAALTMGLVDLARILKRRRPSPSQPPRPRAPQTRVRSREKPPRTTEEA